MSWLRYYFHEIWLQTTSKKSIIPVTDTTIHYSNPFTSCSSLVWIKNLNDIKWKMENGKLKSIGTGYFAERGFCAHCTFADMRSFYENVGSVHKTICFFGWAFSLFHRIKPLNDFQTAEWRSKKTILIISRQRWKEHLIRIKRRDNCKNSDLLEIEFKIKSKDEPNRIWPFFYLIKTTNLNKKQTNIECEHLWNYLNGKSCKWDVKQINGLNGNIRSSFMIRIFRS